MSQKTMQILWRNRYNKLDAKDTDYGWHPHSQTDKTGAEEFMKNLAPNSDLFEFKVEPIKSQTDT